MTIGHISKVCVAGFNSTIYIKIITVLINELDLLTNFDCRVMGLKKESFDETLESDKILTTANRSAPRREIFESWSKIVL